MRRVRRPRCGRVHDGRGVDVALVGADPAYGTVPRAQDVRHRPAGEEAGARGADEVGGGQGGHDLAVLGVVDGAREAGGQVGFEVVQAVAHDRLGGDPDGPLPVGEPLQHREPVRGRGHDDAALRLVLDGRPELLRQLTPETAGQQREVELGARLLVGDKEVALAGAGGAGGHRATVDEDHGEARPSRVQGAGRAHHPGSDDHDVAGQSLAHASTMSHTTL